MLRRLHIRHYAIVSDLTLDFSTGMTVLSGETGAGKSILLDALALTLGDRAEVADIATGADRAEISASFEIDNLPLIQQWLAEAELDSEAGECIIRRTLNRDGRSRGYINGQSVPLKQIRELGEQLIELHGQHAHQNLLKSTVQRQQLDLFSHQSSLAAEVESHYRHWRQLQQQRQQLQQQQQERHNRLDLLNFQIEELEQLALQEGELEELELEQRRLAHLQEIVTTCQSALYQLDEHESAALLRLLNRISGEISQLATFDRQLESCAALLDSTAIQLHEAVNELRHYRDQLDPDPQQQEQVEQRLSDIQQLARKHRLKPEALPQRLPLLHEEQQRLQQADLLSEQLDGQIEAALQCYQQAAIQLTHKRQRGAVELAQIVTQTMQQLGLSNGAFRIELLPLAEPTVHGAEEVSFQITTNPGQPFRPLERVASGGELSRVSLAIQVNSADKNHIPTMIFDEVDVGIGGQTAAMVGQLLRRLGGRCQVICVTHQPQVAASGHSHYQIRKRHHANQTETTVHRIEEQERIAEIARMSGGLEINPETLRHAEALIRRMQAE